MLSIDREHICFEGEKNDGEKVTIEHLLKNLYTVVQKKEEGIDLTIDDVVNRFYFTEKKYSAKYNLYVEESFRRINNLH